jgi:hypothetical protein
MRRLKEVFSSFKKRSADAGGDLAQRGDGYNFLNTKPSPQEATPWHSLPVLQP